MDEVGEFEVVLLESAPAETLAGRRQFIERKMAEGYLMYKAANEALFLAHPGDPSKESVWVSDIPQAVGVPRPTAADNAHSIMVSHFSRSSCWHT